MKKIFVILIVLYSQFCFPQKNPINGYAVKVNDIEFLDCVKSLSIKTQKFSKRKQKIDTFQILNKIFIDEDKKITKRLDFRKSFKNENPWQIIEYDKYNRIKSLKRTHNDSITLVIKQFFTNNTIYPDSTNFYYKGKIKSKQYKNVFKDLLVIKQEFYTADTLRSYSTFQYDSKNRLIKELDINTKNGFGVTFDKSFTGSKTEKQLNPNDSITYRYQKLGDTLQIRIEKQNKLYKIKKEFINNEIKLDVNEKYIWGYLSEIQYNYKWKDSSKYLTKRFDRNGDLISYYKSTIFPDKIIQKRKYSLNESSTENIDTTTIEVIFDEKGNWIKKFYKKNDFIDRIITREIEYYCH
jgi:hypothetical protein